MEEFDIYITENGRFIAEDYDINFLCGVRESSIPTMPEANESTARIAGRDGDIVLSTTYEPITFNLVCYTNPNLTKEEKVAEERKVNRLLNDMKNNTKTFAIEKYSKFYNVKYSGNLTTTNYPMHMVFSIPLKSSSAFGYGLTEKSIVGNGTKNSDTDKEVGAIFTINGPAQTPKISLNDWSMEYGTDILTGAKLVIDTNKSTVTNISSTGIKANAMKYYNHQFPKIQNGTNELKILSGIDDATQVSVKWHDYIL